MKILWRDQLSKDTNWEAKADRMSRYPYLFPSTPTQA